MTTTAAKKEQSKLKGFMPIKASKKGSKDRKKGNATENSNLGNKRRKQKEANKKRVESTIASEDNSTDDREELEMLSNTR